MNKTTKMIAAATLSTVLLTGCETKEFLKTIESIQDWFIDVDSVDVEHNVVGMVVAPTATPNPDIDSKKKHHSASFLKFYDLNASFNAFANWSGQEVPFPIQSIPSKRRIASSTENPSINRETPCVFPWHPPKNLTDVIIPSLISKSIFWEQTPLG